MSWFSAIKKAVAAPVRVGLAPIKLTAQAARHPLNLRNTLRAGVAAGLAPARVARATMATSLALSPHALAVKKLRRAVARGGRKTPVRVAAAPSFWGGSAAPSGGGGGGGGGGGAYAADDGYDPAEDEDLPDDGGGDDGGGDDDGLSGIDYEAHLAGTAGLAGWTDDLEKIGISAAKGAASGLLSSTASALQSRPPVTAPPPPKGMSTTAKVAIGVGVAVPLLYLLTHKRGSAAPVAA
jgi:hypothetical protein